MTMRSKMLSSDEADVVREAEAVELIGDEQR